jgi:hypothetical protein
LQGLIILKIRPSPASPGESRYNLEEKCVKRNEMKLEYDKREERRKIGITVVKKVINKNLQKGHKNMQRR